MPSRQSLAGSLTALVALIGLAGCGSGPSDLRAAPGMGVCRTLSPSDVGSATNNSPAVDCKQPHTAQTFYVGELPASVKNQGPDAGSFVYAACNPAFAAYIGADDSLLLRIQLSWAWFGPSAAGWAKGARWFRCDVVGGPAGAQQFAPLPASVKSLFGSGFGDFQGTPPDQWLTCGRGNDFATRKLVSCATSHDWRAVTTVKLGQPGDPYPGDHGSEVRAHNFCADAISAWLNYSSDYDFGYTWFHEAEWKAGNRRAVCWARTPN